MIVIAHVLSTSIEISAASPFSSPSTPHRLMHACVISSYVLKITQNAH